MRLLSASLSAMVLGGVGLGWAAQSHLTSGLQFSDALDALAGSGPKSRHGDANILLIGLDSRKAMDGSDLPAQFVTDELHAGDSGVGGYNTNTLILLHVPGDGSRATAAAIPRDDYVSVPGYGMRKIKEAYGLAKADEDSRLAEAGVDDAEDRERQSRDAGRRSTLATVQNLLQVPIDHFAEVNMLGFYHLAQAVGPVKVCLNNAVQDDFSGADFLAGPQSLDPAQALAFVRQRHGLDNGDLDRTHRQQAFIAGVIANLKNSGVIGNIGKMQSLVDIVKKDVVIDSGMDPVSFASQADNLTSGNLDFFTLPIEEYATVDGQSVNRVDPDRLRAEIAALFGSGRSAVVQGGRQAPSLPDRDEPARGAAPDEGLRAFAGDVPSSGPQGGAVRADDGIPCVD
ncbi:LCP family protein required for cell wall assembly [Rhodococcus sp. PvR044]|uniref:LCP family protein n=1 Tax=Rhodococcus TaxID=1827 RepID=UPI000BCB9977|nr:MULTISPECIES: LCP family protein [Rhodococcus]MBP1161260.1 LCP family protein required for cell wall assembly [Rhodococcus sp. PvR099]MCZ4559012.1 LCP family protein [Rhodococcus maanshanensis]PTR44795.1 LytR family transcriptional attenuator [Rhodococcus sp. OK611]SNX93884.1 transcriptional attenuator, LytR family [Rhodococcus sp. OK270]